MKRRINLKVDTSIPLALSLSKGASPQAAHLRMAVLRQPRI
jgi:hypothetical protein